MISHLSSTVVTNATEGSEVQDLFRAHLRRRGYADSTIAQYALRLCAFRRRATRGGRDFVDLDREQLLAMIGRLRGAEKVVGRAFMRAWIRFRSPTERRACHPWQSWIDDFLDFRVNHQAICRDTLARQSRTVRKYLAWQFGQEPCSWPTVTVRDIWRYCEQSTRRYKPSFANQQLSTLRAFLRFVHLRGACPLALVNAVSYRAC